MVAHIALQGCFGTALVHRQRRSHRVVAAAVPGIGGGVK